MRVVRTLVAVLALLAFAAPAAAADERGGGGGRHPSVVPADRVAGNLGGRLVGDWYVENLSRPASASPFGGTANLCLDIGRHDKVLTPAGGIIVEGQIEMSCTVKVGRPVVLIMTSADCSSAEAPPFFGATAKAQRSCVVDALNGVPIQSIKVTVDERRPVDIYRPTFFEVSPQRHVVFPADPVFGAEPGPATFVSAAWMAEIRGLKRGEHTIVGTTTFGDGSATPFIVHLTVVRGGKG